MRIFIALDIDDSIRQGIQRFVDAVSGFAPDARWVRAESLHVTLKFIGEKPEETVDKIKRALSGIPTGKIEIIFRSFGFFPGAKAPRVFWIGVESGPQLAALAGTVDAAMAALGIPKEHRFNPHLTLARGGGRSGAPGLQKGDAPNRIFQRLQEKLAVIPTPEFGTMTAREFFLYQSQPMRGGSRYTKIACFPPEPAAGI
jgi:RNA 2',3'-cyclic 3'-phosphodiesterase